MYKEMALNPKGEYHFELGRSLAERLGYNPEILNHIPQELIESFAGVGYYFDLANLQKGETVIDFGCGSGMDSFYTARLVGKDGIVIGIDMTPAQIAKAESSKDKIHLNQVCFHRNYIEDTKLGNSCIDVAISNGVINLVCEKENVFKEISRVLKPGGRLVLSDIVSSVSFSEKITFNPELWSACVAGAVQIDEYKNLIEAAGLSIIEVKENPYQFISNRAKSVTRNHGIKSISLLAIKI